MTRVDALCLLSTGNLLRILIPLEEPPHLTADLSVVRSWSETNMRLSHVLCTCVWFLCVIFLFGVKAFSHIVIMCVLHFSHLCHDSK